MIPKAKQLLKNPKGRATTALLAAVMLFLTSFFGYTAYAYGEKTINLVQNGKKISITTRTDTVANLLKERGINVDKLHDKVKPGLQSEIKDGLTVTYDKAHKVAINQDGKTAFVWSTEHTVGDLLKDEGIQIGDHDSVIPSVNEKISGSMSVKIERGFQVTLTDGIQAKTVWATPMTVQEFLKQQKVTLDQDDRVEAANLDEQLKAGSKVSVIRVEKKKEEKPETIDYKVVQKYDASLPKGSTQVIQAGLEGQMIKTFEVTYENGKEVKRDLIKTEVQKQPKDKIVAVGTKVVHQTAYRGSRGFSGNEKTLYMRSTAYTADCKGCGGYTATGLNLKLHPDAKVIAVDPRVIPLGTKVYVEGYGYAVAADTGGSIHGNKIDIFFPTQSQAANWGLRTVKVRILN
ncbi:MAG: ubiquitin-like domain-containing protein [Tuberibacillus sp.]